MTNPPPARGNRLGLVVAALVGIGAVIGTYLVFRPDTTTVSCESTVPLVLSSSTEKSDLLAEIADQYNEAGRIFGDGRCAEVEVYPLTSGAAKSALARGWQPELDGGPQPQVWTPTSSLWLRLLEAEGKDDLVANEPASLTKSTMVIAMPKVVADALDVAEQDFGWQDIRDLATGQGWAEHGRPGWGQFVLARDNAHVSTSGLAATVATYHAATRESGGITRAALTDSEVVPFVRDIESSVGRYGDEAVQFMESIYEHEQQNAGKPDYRPYIDAVVIQEQLAYLYNRGAPGGDPDQMRPDREPEQELVVVHPDDETLEMDHPYVVLDNADADQRAAADDFRTYLTRPEQQQRFIDIGFRERTDRPTDELVTHLDIDAGQRLKVIDLPDPELVADMLNSWDNVRKKARVLLVLDVSGSMNERVADPGIADLSRRPTRLELLKAAAKQGLELLGPNDEVGLWTFSSDYREVVPTTRVADVHDELVRQIDDLTARGETALYRTTAAAHRAMADSLDENRINGIVLLSDGENTEEYPPKEQGLLNEIDASQWDNSVRIFTIPYSADAKNVQILADIAERTKAVSYDARDPLEIQEVFVNVFRNFG